MVAKRRAKDRLEGGAAGTEDRRRGSGRSSGRSREVLERASEIAERSGLAEKDAVRVAMGNATVRQVLEEMMFREEVERLMKAHGLQRGAAREVARGTADLESLLLLRELRECEAWRRNESVLDRFHRDGKDGIFHLFGRQPFRARVARIQKYDCWLAQAGREPEKMEKHNILMVCLPEERSELETLKGLDAETAGLNLGPSASYRDRFRSSKRVLFTHHRDRVLTRVVLRDGSVVTGTVGWFGRWEFSMHLSGTCGPVVFRHALHRLQAMESAGKEGAGAEGSRRKRKSGRAARGRKSGGKTGGRD